MTKYIGPKTDGENVATQADKLSLSSETPDALTPDQTGAAGTATTAARSDHQHEILAGAAGTIQPDDTAAEGSSTSFARADHRHAIAAASAGTITGTNAEGTSTSFARADHNHAIADGTITSAMLNISTVSDTPSSDTTFNGSSGGTNVTGLSISCVAGTWLLFASLDYVFTSGGIPAISIYNQTDSAAVGVDNFVSGVNANSRFPILLFREAVFTGTKTIGVRLGSGFGTSNHTVNSSFSRLTGIRIA